MTESIQRMQDYRSSQERILERIVPLVPSNVGPSRDGVGVEMTLLGSTNGKIVIKYESYESNLQSPITTAISYIETPDKDPFQGIATALTLAATINQTAMLVKSPIRHKVLANKKSRPLFERLKEWGMYDYCNALGEPVSAPVMVNGKAFYSSLFPNKEIEAKLGKYANLEASSLLLEKYPTPMRLLMYRIANTAKRK